MTLDLDELERKAKAVMASNANLPDGEPPYSMGLAASDVLALIERVRDVEAEKAADAERAEYWRVEANRVHAEALAKANERVRELERDRHTVAHELGCAEDAGAYAAQVAMARIRKMEAALVAIRDDGLSRDDARDEARKALT